MEFSTCQGATDGRFNTLKLQDLNKPSSLQQLCSTGMSNRSTHQNQVCPCVFAARLQQRAHRPHWSWWASNTTSIADICILSLHQRNANFLRLSHSTACPLEPICHCLEQRSANRGSRAFAALLTDEFADHWSRAFNTVVPS